MVTPEVVNREATIRMSESLPSSLEGTEIAFMRKALVCLKRFLKNSNEILDHLILIVALSKHDPFSI